MNPKQFKQTMAAGLIVGLGAITYFNATQTPNIPETVKPQQELLQNPLQTIQNDTITDFATVAITGIRGVPQLDYQLQPKQQLQRLWELKELNSGLDAQARQKRDHALRTFDDTKRTQTTLEGLISHTDEVLLQTRNNLDMNQVQRYTSIGSNPQVFGNVLEQIDGKVMTTIMLNELFGADKNARNLRSLDFIVQEAGLEYLYEIPSIGDKLSSFGPYQLTKHAVQKHPLNPDAPMGGANRMSQALPTDMQLPHSVNEIRGDQHHQAAALLAYKNVADFLSTLTPSQLENFDEQIPHRKDDLVKYISAAHHKRTPSIRAANKWVTSGMDADILYYLEQEDPAVARYATTAQQNLELLFPDKPWIQDSPVPNRYNSTAQVADGFDSVYEVQVRPGDTASRLSREFNELHKDRYKETGYLNVVNQDKQPVSRLQPNQTVYLLAKHQ